MRKQIIIFILIISNISFAQIYENWVIRYNGSGNYIDEAKEIVVDQSDNTYVTGYSLNLNLEFDYATFKYDACGNTLWSKIFNYDDDYAHDLKIDGSGNVYVTGSLLSNSVYSFGTVKYSNSGIFQWNAISGGPVQLGSSSAVKMCVDNNGNSYITGVTSQLSSPAVYDVMTIKYNSSGVYQWRKIYNFANGDDKPEDITKDSQGNIYIAGGSAVSGGEFDFFLLRYSPGGLLTGEVRYNGEANGSDGAKSVEVDDQGNIYVTGISKEYEIPQGESSGQNTFTTIKYNSNFEQQWIRKYYGTGATRNARGNNIKILNTNEIYVSGYAKESGTENDFVTIKYNSSGAVLWISKYNRIGNFEDVQTSLSIDSYGNAYVTGESRTDVFINTGDYAIVKYNSSGTQQWAKHYNGPANLQDIPNAIVNSGNDVVYVTGNSKASNNEFDYSTVRYSNQWLVCSAEESYSNNLNDVIVINNDTAFAVGNNGKLIFTADKGRNWINLNSGTNLDLINIKFVNRTTGFITGDSILLKTTNSGLNWNVLNLPVSNLKHIFILNNRFSSITGSNGRLLGSFDNWNTWSIQNTNLNENIITVFYKDSLNGKCISESGKLLKTTNGGINWLNQSNININRIKNSYFNDINTIIAIGDNGKIMYTSNSGITWINRSTSTNVNLRSVYMTEENNLYVSGNNGIILFSSDQGLTWAKQPANLNTTINSLQFFNSNSGIAVTDEGQILLTSLGTVEMGNENRLLSFNPDYKKNDFNLNNGFELFQNFPNPFNPITQINYTLPENTFVTIKVYNVLGKEVKSLVNEYMDTGDHFVNFDATGLSSGIYFYKIFAGSNIDQKQMLLIK
ncbi:MAG: T9SS type A sorting domain-containing protein [Ignavibacteria bacterium]|nr:T9SS type A sorting domain-containing protein [Ignavibacteria bacterium]